MVELARAGEPADVALLFATLASSIASGRRLGLLAGWDGDAWLRAQLRGAGATAPLAEAAALAELPAPARAVALLQRASCPLCRATARGELSYLSFLASSVDARRHEEFTVCPAHLHDLVREGVPGERAMAAVAAAIARRLEALEPELGAPSRPLARTRVKLTSHDAFVGLEAVLSPSSCRVCRAARDAAEREAELFGVTQGHPEVSAALARAHGPCRWHARAFPGGEIFERRRAVVAFELREALRKQVWTRRFEARAYESRAWREAATLHDGRIFLGVSCSEIDDSGAGRDGHEPR